MLGFIRGKIISKNEESNQCIVLAHRLGYEVTVPKTLLGELGIGNEVALWLHTHVREDIFSLFGFASDAERQFFRVLLGVSGLGPKTALALIGGHGVSRLVQFILEKNFVALSEAPGVGKKLAERLVLELSGKIEKLAFLRELKALQQPSSIVPPSKLREDLISAMLNLGYGSSLVRNTLDSLFTEPDMATIDFESALKRTLKEMYRKAP